MRSLPKLAAGVGMASLMVAATGCGSGSTATPAAGAPSTTATAAPSATATAAPSTTAAAGGPSSTAAGALSATGTDLGAVGKQLAAYEGIPSFESPGPAINVASLKGKTIYSIPQSTAIPFLSVTEQAEAAIAKRYGINFVEYSTQGQTNQWVQGIDQAISTHAAGIMLNALDPRLVAPQIAAAKAAGIPVENSQFADLTQSSQLPSALSAIRDDKFTEAGTLEAAWAIQATSGHADVVVVENKEQLSTLAMEAAIKSEFATYCPQCKVTYLNVPSTDWATRIQPDVEAALASDPSINYVIPIYDPMSQFVIPAITAAGKTGSVHIATFNGTPFALKDLADNDVITMDIGENMDWLASANLDEMFRTMMGQPAVADEHTPLRVFTKANVGETGNPPAYNLGFGSAYAAGYAALWGPTS
jgi:ribose transport system substrate-binding protein